MGQHLVKQALIRIAGFDNLPVIAPIHGRVISGQIEARLVFVRVVAIQATILEQRPNSLLISHAGLRRSDHKQDCCEKVESHNGQTSPTSQTS